MPCEGPLKGRKEAGLSLDLITVLRESEAAQRGGSDVCRARVHEGRGCGSGIHRLGREELRGLIRAAFATPAGWNTVGVIGWSGWSVRVTDRGIIAAGGPPRFLVTLVIAPRTDGPPAIVASRLGWKVHYVQPAERVPRPMPHAVSLLRKLIEEIGPGGRLPGDREICRGLRVGRPALNAARAKLSRERLLVEDAIGWSVGPAPEPAKVKE
jgi:hypothetical protein